MAPSSSRQVTTASCPSFSWDIGWVVSMVQQLLPKYKGGRRPEGRGLPPILFDGGGIVEEEKNSRGDGALAGFVSPGGVDARKGGFVYRLPAPSNRFC